MFDHDQWAHYYLGVGHKDGRLEGYCVGGIWGFVAGFLTASLFLWWN